MEALKCKVTEAKVKQKTHDMQDQIVKRSNTSRKALECKVRGLKVKQKLKPGHGMKQKQGTLQSAPRNIREIMVKY